MCVGYYHFGNKYCKSEYFSKDRQNANILWCWKVNGSFPVNCTSDTVTIINKTLIAFFVKINTSCKIWCHSQYNFDCTGTEVPVEDQFELKAAAAAVSVDADTPGTGPANIANMLGSLTGSMTGSTITETERAQWEREKMKIYQQLDDKACTDLVFLEFQGSG